jgi:hypothetical protein
VFKRKPKPVAIAPIASFDWLDSDDEPPPGIETAMFTVRGLLRSAVQIIVPPYQRAYAWGELEVEKLLNDFDSESCFIGTSVRQRAGAGIYHVIDGQQRLMTLTLVIAFLRDAIDDPAVKAHLQDLIAPEGKGRLVARRADQELVSEFVQKPGRLAELEHNGKSPSQQRLAEAADLIVQRFSDLDQDELNALAEFVCTKVTINVVDADQSVSAATLFNMLNQRGLRLQESALVKSQLLVSSGMPEKEASALSDRWDEVEADLGQDDFEQFLRITPRLVATGAKAKSASLSLFYDEDFAGARAAAFVRTQIWEFASIFRLFSAAAIDEADAPAELKHRLRMLLMYQEKLWLAPAIDFLSRYPLDAPETHTFFHGLERLCFIKAMGGIQPRQVAPRFGRVLAARGDMAKLFEPNVLGFKEGEALDLVARLNRPWASNTERRRCLALRANAVLGEVLLCDFKYATAEHVLPLSDTEFWRKHFPKADARELGKDLLGNMAILTASQNIEAGDHDYPTKRKVFFSKKYPLRALTRTLEDVEVWNERELRRRHEKLVLDLCQDLKLPLHA